MRILTNPSYRPTAFTFAEVLSSLNELKAKAGYEFWPDDLTLTDPTIFDFGALRGHQQLTDIYLLALTVKHGGRFVTFDRSIPPSAVRGATAEHLVVL